MIERKKTRIIHVGDVSIGGDSPISIQSMTNTDTKDILKTSEQILRLKNEGADMVRMAVNDEEDAKSIQYIKPIVALPLIADIQYDYRLALSAVKYGFDCIRINPGNLNNEYEIREVVNACKDGNIPIRIGANSGSLSKKLIDKYKGVNMYSLVESVSEQIDLLEKMNFHDIKVAIKSSDVNTCIDANRYFSKNFDYPLHIGLTEAGTLNGGRLKSAIAIGCLLKEGIGDTIRVSLCADPVYEIIAAKEILKALGIINKGINLISCPTCARTKIDIIPIVNELEPILAKIDKNLTVAVMGCPVNGPGEARQADIGCSVAGDFCYIFKKGEIIEKVKKDEIINKLLMHIDLED